MIDLYYWPTPNGHKITMFLEEAGLDYQIFPVDISAGDQFKPEFLAFSPNNRMPAIIDHAPADGGEPVTVFESGAILVYLAEKTGKFLPGDVRGRKTVMEWLFWQMGGLGPMAGQNHHFAHLRAGEASLRDQPLRQRNQSALWRARPPSGGTRFSRRRLFHRRHGGLSLDRAASAARAEPRRFAEPEALVRNHQGAAGDDRAPTPGPSPIRAGPTVTEEGKKLLFGQTAASIAAS